jgi:predicted glutamine amidotransferase
MCVIIGVSSSAARPDAETIRMAEKANSHGGSIAWVANVNGRKQVCWKKGITADEIINLMPKEGHFIIHFRIATRGGQSKEMCHPFPITEGCSTALSGSANSVLFHNGTWNQYKEFLLRHATVPFPKGSWSDSRAMAFAANKFGVDFLELLDEKIAIMDVENFYMFKPEAWTEEAGVYYSNTHFRYKGQSKTYTPDGRRWDSSAGKWVDDAETPRGSGTGSSTKQETKKEEKKADEAANAAKAIEGEIDFTDILREAIVEIKHYVAGFDTLDDAVQLQMIEDFSGIVGVSSNDVREVLTYLKNPRAQGTLLLT